MNKKKNILLLSLFLALSCVSAIFVSEKFDNSIKAYSIGEQNSCVHNGYHYEGHDNSLIVNGNKEFWACCKCHNMYFSRPSGTWTDKSQYSYDLKDTEAYLPSVARDIGNFSNATAVAGQLDGYAFENYYSFHGYAQGILLENINISRYQTVIFAFKSESLWFIIQDPGWTNSRPNGYWYQIVLEQIDVNTWDIYVGRLGEELSIHASSYVGTDLKTIVGLGSDVGDFYITNIMAVYKQTEIVGDKIDECLFTANGAQTFKTYEPIPSGFEQVRVTNTKTAADTFFSGELYSAVDLSSYSKVKFAIKTMGYFLCNHQWNSYINGSKDWMIFELTKVDAYLWNLVITDYNGAVYYSEDNLSGDMGANPGVYTTNSLNAILVFQMLLLVLLRINSMALMWITFMLE